VLLALARLGLAGVSVHGPAPKSLKVDAFISDRKIPARVVDRLILADLSWTEGDGTPIERPRVSSGGAETCRVILTSGTTGYPKAVAVSHQLMTARIARHITVFGSRFANCQRIYSDMPISMPLGFQLLIYTLSQGGTYFLPGDSFKTTLQAIEEYKVQCVLAPPNGHELLLKWFEALPSYQSNICVKNATARTKESRNLPVSRDYCGRPRLEAAERGVPWLWIAHSVPKASRGHGSRKALALPHPTEKSTVS
jgi:hypothetical protein